MPDPLILYHYPMSPFSQKVRAMLGYTQLPWQSVTVREMPPRPVLQTLVGGYRKIPVAQIGADIFCDTKTIATEVARLSGRRTLALERCGQAAQAQARRADQDMLFACLMAANTLAMGRKMLRSMSMFDIPRFLWDRLKLGRSAGLARSIPRNPRDVVRQHLEALETRLQKQVAKHADGFLFGATPNHADFSTYHALWFLRDLGQSPLTADFAEVNAWLDRINAWGEGPHSALAADAALDAARRARPRPIAARNRTDQRIGQPVSIQPDDYGQDETRGVLVGASPSQWILAREAPGVGRVHVHFPKAGYTLSAATEDE